MHEWGSNIKSDFSKITSNNCPAWTAEAITETIRRAFPYEHTFLEAMSAEEYAALGGIPETWQEYLAVMEKLFADRQNDTNGDLLPCDSGYQAPKLEVEAGARRLMPEIGAQTSNTRIQVAYARGMARAAGVPFGTYYEPWDGNPFSSCCYHKDGKNEWNISAESFPFRTAGGNGGSSRSLQRRLHLYSYMAGAEFMAEEWGMCNTFLDWETFELSDYGKVKKDFLDFTDRYPDLGKPIVPCAVVLPKEMKVLPVYFKADSYLGYPVEGQFAKALCLTENALRHLFLDHAPMCGSEQKNLLNGLTPDAIDIIHEDSPTVEEYAILVDCTANPDFAASYRNRIRTPEEAREILCRTLPIIVRGGVSMQLTEHSETGEIFLLLLNNSGVERSVEQGEVLLPEGKITVEAALNGSAAGKALSKAEGNGTITASDDGSYRITIPSGGWLFGAIRRRSRFSRPSCICTFFVI